MLRSRIYQALGISARRVLDFLIQEHASHSGQENGRLKATYKQMQVFGVTACDISKGLAELQAAGFVVVTRQGYRIAAQKLPSTYYLTFYQPAHDMPPEIAQMQNKWLRVQSSLTRQGMNVGDIRKWLGQQVKESGIGGRRIGQGKAQSVTQHQANDAGLVAAECGVSP